MAVVQERELYSICVHVGRYGSITNNAIIIDLKLTALQVYSMVMRHEPSLTVSIMLVNHNTCDGNQCTLKEVIDEALKTYHTLTHTHTHPHPHTPTMTHLLLADLLLVHHVSSSKDSQNS